MLDALLGKYAELEALEDERLKILCFASKADAQRFKQFCNLYIDESGAGNGYGAYWVYTDTKISRCRKVASRCVIGLDTELIESMLHRILVARTAIGNPQVKVGYVVGIRDGAIFFTIGEFPPRQRPGVGDMYRIPRSALDETNLAESEGRVVKDLGDILEVISCYNEERDGSIKPNAKVVRVKVTSVMKINDWLASRR